MGMRKKDLRVVGKPSTEGHYVLQDPRVKPEDDTFMKETEDAPSSERRILGGIGGSRKGDESGRSMVEMLGVLAIMGLLAIGGIMAYRYAVTKYQANETFNELRRRVVIHSQQSITGTPLSQVEMGETTQMGYPIAVARVDSGFFELTLQDIDKRLCQEMVRTGWTLPTQTRVNGIVVGTNPAACGEENVLVFRFQAEMGGCKTDADCPCGTCANGTCQTSCSSGESCVKNFDDGQYVCCPGGKVVGNSCCEHPGENGTCCDENSKYCCPPDKPLYAQGKCYDCEEQFVIFGVDTANTETRNKYVQICNRCQDRWVSSYHNFRCYKPCPEGEIIDYTGTCHTCDDSSFFRLDGTDPSWYLSAEECFKCPGVRFAGSGDYGQWSNYGTGCYNCYDPEQSVEFGTYGTPSYTGGSRKHQNACDACPNRRSINDLYCAKYCEDGKVWDNVGQCHACDEEADFNVQGVPENKCACPGVRYLDGNMCKKCPEDLSALTPEQQAQCGG